MAWFEEAVFYHIYPLGLTGAPHENPYGEPVHRLRSLEPWIGHIKSLGCTALYIGPLFESVGHGYETTDYRRLDSRLGTNEDLAAFVRQCHEAGLRVILDAVFNHTGRDFFAFRDLRENRERSRYRDWYCDVNFAGNNEFGDGFSYTNWGGYDLLAKLNLRNPEVRDYLLDTVRFWREAFDIDGLRLDAADVLDFDFMRALRHAAREVKEDFYLMGEVIHGDYQRWANAETLNAVTNYHLHKALYSAHNDHNYFEIAHTVRRQQDMGLTRGARLYNFADNHDVERIASRLREPAHYRPLHVLLYTLPGVPSVYYGSEFGIQGRKERWSDAPLRPYLNLAELTAGDNPCLSLIRALGRIRGGEKALSYGDYRELLLTNTQYAFARGDVLVTVNNGGAEASFDLPASSAYRGALSGERALEWGGRIHLRIPGNGGEIWIPEGERSAAYEPVQAEWKPEAPTPEEQAEHRGQPRRAEGKPYEEMDIEELQGEILAKLAANGPVTERMKSEVLENVYKNSLLNWVRSFR